MPKVAQRTFYGSRYVSHARAASEILYRRCRSFEPLESLPEPAAQQSRTHPTRSFPNHFPDVMQTQRCMPIWRFRSDQHRVEIAPARGHCDRMFPLKDCAPPPPVEKIHTPHPVPREAKANHGLLGRGCQVQLLMLEVRGRAS